ncbi:MAG: bifunctional methylenetetrahydrofolate dehydrogenase/methenyltetrahydrofolate cyclohydrolase FolD [Erysipelotrichaceae bacterium]|nr:bifunctional methylenetetrahydrofolate dehydrogenase/methenyltetrahydrofolate cyclohydrolase FolD [Erysipelotrichaceae bacterium]
MAEIIYGNLIAKDVKNELKEQIELLKREKKKIPFLCVVLVGNNPASLSYIKGKEKACNEIGMDSQIIHLDENTSEKELILKINELNNDEKIDGILVQMPLPSHIDENRVMESISSFKDVDGLNPYNIGKLYLKEDGMIPCTPLGIVELLKRSNITIKSKKVVVIGRSKLVGNPVAKLLLDENATVTICHSKTENLKEIAKSADILIVAIGREKFVDKTFVKDNAVVIDVGINRNSEGKLVGDVDFDDVKEVASYITPVPKGVGPMTIAMLLSNTFKAYLNKEKING